MRHTVERHQMVFAGGVQRDLVDQHQLVVLLVECGVQHGVGVGVQTGEHLLITAGYPGGGVRQTVPIRVLADRKEQFADRGLGTCLVKDRFSQRRSMGIRPHHRSLRSVQPCACGLDGLGPPPGGSAAWPASGAGAPGGGYGGYGG